MAHNWPIIDLLKYERVEVIMVFFKKDLRKYTNKNSFIENKFIYSMLVSSYNTTV